MRHREERAAIGQTAKGLDRLAVIAALWCLSYGLYLLFAGSVSETECLTAAVVSTMAIFWARLVVRCTRQHFAFTTESAAILLSGLLKLPKRLAESLLPLAGLSGSSPARAMVERFDIGDKADPRERTRRALAVLAASLAPDSYVIRADLAEGQALLHAIVTRGAPDARSLL